MLQQNQCWRCDIILPSLSPTVSCTRCEVASYCSEDCKRSDVFRHQVDCETAALKKKCAGCGKQKMGLKSCGSCSQAWYCDQICQKKSWPKHKVHCQMISRKTEELCYRLKLVYDHKMSKPGLSFLYYWGNIPAVDLINLPLNEGVCYDKPLSLLLCGVGDPRNVALSMSQLPDDYKEELTFVLNDFCACTMARTVLILYMLIKGGDQIASSVTQIWYSLRLSENDHQLVIRILQKLIQAPNLEELTGGTMKIEQNQFQNLAQVWRTWLDLSASTEDWITEARRRWFGNDPGSGEGIDMYLKEIPNEHKQSASDWFANGILLPKESQNELPRENFTLTGFTDNLNRSEGRYTYLIPGCVTPFTSWDYKEVKKHFHCASLLKMYSRYVGHVLKKFALKLATGRVKFHFLLGNCMEMAPFLPSDRKYDRITTSNIADYVPLSSILDMCKPLLNTILNPSSVIVTGFQNWSNFTNLEREEKLHVFTFQSSFRQNVLKDTQNPAIANSTRRQGFAEYHDHSGEFIIFLRAALLVADVPQERKHKRTWKSVAEYNGLIARNFLRCQNKVFPAKWLLNCRRVTMLHGFERAVEWIINPK